MIDVIISVIITAILTSCGTVLMFRMKLRNRDEIMTAQIIFMERVNALRTAFQTTNQYKVKANNIITEINHLELDALVLFESMRWPWVSFSKKKNVYRAYIAFKTAFDNFQWTDCNQAASVNKAKSEELAKLLTALILAVS